MQKPELGDQPIEPEFATFMQDIMYDLNKTFNGNLKPPNRKVGIVLMVFPYGETGRCNYISNGANRHDIVRLFEEQIKRFRSDPPME